MNNTNTWKLLTTFNLLGYEVLIETTPYSDFSYIKESATEREFQLGKVRVIISKAAPSPNKLVFERFN